MRRSFPEEVLEHVLSFIDSHADRNSVALVCKSWYEIERWCRRRVFIGNCYAVSPPILIRRFRDVRSLIIKGKPHFADFNLVPDGWGAHALPWISALAAAYPALEELRMKRMVVSDEALELIGKKFKNFRALVLCYCEGLSTDGLASIAANCRNLRTLDLCETVVEDVGGNWISHFPDSYTSLEALNVSCLKSELPYSTLERLAGRCPNLKTLQVNRAFPLEKLANVLRKAPQLVDLGTGSLIMEPCPQAFTKLTEAFAGCNGLKSLSGLWNVVPSYLPAVYPVCPNLTFFNLSFAVIHGPKLIKLLIQCVNLQRLWVLDLIEDGGLEELAASCKELQELRVFPSNPYGPALDFSLTEQGLVSVAVGCPKLRSILYFCHEMTNEALITIAKNRPNLTHFRLCIIEPHLPDYRTHKPLDVGFGAIVAHCQNLKRLSLGGLITDRLFEYIGTHGKKLEMLSLAFVGNSDSGLDHILSGCTKLKKLEIRDCPFGDEALLANAQKLETMRSLWMSSCLVSYGACKSLGLKHPRLNVEVIDDRGSAVALRIKVTPGSDSISDKFPVRNLYVYRSVAGPRSDAPRFVWITNQNEPQQLSVVNGLGVG